MTNTTNIPPSGINTPLTLNPLRKSKTSTLAYLITKPQLKQLKSITNYLNSNTPSELQLKILADDLKSILSKVSIQPLKQSIHIS